MISLEHPAIHLYMQDKDKMKVMVKNRFKDLLGEWTVVSLDDYISADFNGYLSLSSDERKILASLFDLELAIEKVIIRRQSIIIHKNSEFSWNIILDTLSYLAGEKYIYFRDKWA